MGSRVEERRGPWQRCQWGRAGEGEDGGGASIVDSAVEDEGRRKREGGEGK